LSQEEVARLIDAAKNLLDYTMLMTLYGTGMRRAELIHLKVEDIESQRMIVHIRQGKRNRDRDRDVTNDSGRFEIVGQASCLQRSSFVISTRQR